jgi:16S rRNA (guanine527-N7)-methyltransferase
MGPDERLAEAARLRGFPGGEESLARLRGVLEAVVRKNRDVNLTSATTYDEAVDVLALSAFAVVAGWPRGKPPRIVVDLGSGNGFPGVLAALAWPSCRVLLVERRAKKARAVGDALAEAGVPNAEALAADGRDLLRLRADLRGAVDLVTARAVGSTAEVNAIAAPWLAPKGRILHWKGENLPDAEVEEARRAAKGLGLVAVPEPALGSPPPGPARLLVYERSPR